MAPRDTKELIERALAPVRQQREQILREVEVLLREVDAKKDEVRELEKLLKYDPRRVAEKPRPSRGRAQKKERPASTTNARGEAKKYPGISITDAKVDKILEAMRIVGEPAARGRIYQALGKGVVAEGTVGRILSELANANIIRKAGMMQGVRGRRPMYALWPNPVSGNLDDDVAIRRDNGGGHAFEDRQAEDVWASQRGGDDR